jgi:pSer/pThr/pTyr-binding forkhead associated (FHA) protein
MPAFLLSLTVGPNVPIDRPLMLVGRVKGADVRLRSPKVARRQCVLAVARGALVVRDLGGGVGVAVNGRRVAEARLAAGDELAIGPYRYEVCGDASV